MRASTGLALIAALTLIAPTLAATAATAAADKSAADAGKISLVCRGDITPASPGLDAVRTYVVEHVGAAWRLTAISDGSEQRIADGDSYAHSATLGRPHLTDHVGLDDNLIRASSVFADEDQVSDQAAAFRANQRMVSYSIERQVHIDRTSGRVEDVITERLGTRDPEVTRFTGDCHPQDRQF